MQYRIGQKVRLLHDSGEGIITSLVDKNHVEVDLGDDFPIDVHVSEIIAIDSSETRFMTVSSSPVAQEDTSGAERVKTMGASLFDLSLAIVPSKEDFFELILINPEPADILYTCYMKQRNKYTGIAHGQLSSGSFNRLMEVSQVGLSDIRSFYFQVLAYVNGKGHPHSPWSQELPWKKDILSQKPTEIVALDRRGWILSLREDPQVEDVKAIEETEFIRIRKQDTPKIDKPEPVLDLHIEELVDRPHEMTASEMLKTQLAHLDKSLTKALAEQWSSMIVIHGVGVGTLRKTVRAHLRNTPHVKSFESADPGRFGNGATQVFFH